MEHKDKVRLFLVIATVGLMYTSLIAFIITKEALLLGTTTIVGIAEVPVYRYFFIRR